MDFTHSILMKEIALPPSLGKNSVKNAFSADKVITGNDHFYGSIFPLFP